MRAASVLTTATSLFAVGTLANWDSKLCNGAGGCLGLTWFPDAGYNCPNGLSLTRQQLAQNLVDLDSGSYEYVSKAEFPTACYRGVTPGANDKLVLHTAANKLKMYAFITETCREPAPAADCYNQNPNPSSSTLCQILTPVERQSCSLAKEFKA